MVLLTIQKDLNGKELAYEKERVETWKDVLKGGYFQIIISEESHDKISRMREKDNGERKIRDWVANHMKPRQGISLPSTDEGAVFQEDFELFCKILR